MSLNTEINPDRHVVTPAPRQAHASRVLLVEDDEAVSGLLREKLELDGYVVDAAADAESAEADLRSQDYHLIVLDLSLPRMDGLDLLKRLRTHSTLPPILVVTARVQMEERVKALDLGADDYLAKPFEYPELAARVRALLRRSRSSDHIVSRFEDLELNRVDRSVKRAGRAIDLTPKEFALLEYLMMNPGQCLTRAMITERVWREPFSALTNIVDVYINYLRNKVDRGFDHKLIRTVRGFGYRLGDSVPDAQSRSAAS
ncbi:MAG TPA: response regulator transcription factor [Terriglobia bacterium]|nr:response regulator transcription factor [Terriglobia bacterium]